MGNSRDTFTPRNYAPFSAQATAVKSVTTLHNTTTMCRASICSATRLPESVLTLLFLAEKSNKQPSEVWERAE
eukprot:m.486225 g.486225  ORF g.486225 m.486225 type:complete len:73 (+) comp76932_c0_seq1:49-267(+)